MRATFLLFAVCLSCYLKAQLIVNAGRDTTVCAGSPVVLGGNPTASGGTGPYSYQWSPSTGLSCDTCANPVATLGSANTYTVQVVDAAADTATASINVNVNSLPVVFITASDTAICAGQQVNLQASASTAGCGFAPACTIIATSPQIGNGTMLQPGAGTQYPSIFGNLYSSCRQQIVYTASELLQALGGPKTIDGISFDVGQFNSGAYLINSTIKIGCSSMDSLTTWNESLLTVVGPTDIEPSGGWNDFAFSHGYYWDGVSNIVVELCFYNPGLNGSEANKANCTVTPKSSYIYSAANSDQCNTSTTPTVSNIRPNVRFGYCAAPPVTETFLYKWQPSTGTDSVFTPATSNTYAMPDSSTNYYVTVTDTNGCKAVDSAHVSVKPIPIHADSISVKNASCQTIADGGVDISYSSNYTLLSFVVTNLSSHSQIQAIDSPGTGTTYIPDLLPGSYQLHFIDSFCSNINYTFTIGVTDTLSYYTHINIINTTCGMTNGGIQVVIFGQGAISYQLKNAVNTILFSGNTANADTLNFPQLMVGTYRLLLSGCSNLLDTITISSQQQGAIADSITVTNPDCPLQNDGAIQAILFGHGDSVSFKLFHYNSSVVLDSGIIADGSTVNLANLTPDEYSLVLTDSVCLQTDYVNLAIPQSPTYTGDTLTVSCYGDSTASGCIMLSGGVLPYNYTWSDPALNGDCPQHIAAGNYSVTVTDANHCSTVISNIVVLQESQIIVQEIASQQNTANDFITIAITNGTGYYTVDWGDGAVTNQYDTALHQYTASGNDVITVTDGNGCIGRDTVVSSFSVGIIQADKPQIKIYPNPATDQLFVESNDFAIDEIEIVDVTGKQVWQQYLTGVHQSMIDITTLSDGLYLLTARSAGLEYRNLFVKGK